MARISVPICAKGQDEPEGQAEEGNSRRHRTVTQGKNLSQENLKFLKSPVYLFGPVFCSYRPKNSAF
jgi:hypothetical protein